MQLINRRKTASPALRNDEPEPVVATDGELLVRFARHADHCAFTQLVERHGGLVWIVCREMLGHHQDVEDAFQATFLVLAERASSIRSSDSAAAWLHRVAQRTALAARRKRSRQREEALVEEIPETNDDPAAISHRELIYVLLDELRKLPDRYQVPLVLRYFERMTRHAIAAHTDSTIAQIQGRLVRGRRMLRSRMLRRGVSLSLATGAVADVTTEAANTVTPAIASVTAKRCLARKASGDTTGITPMALWLANQGARTMWLTSILKTAATISAVLLVAGITWAVEGGGGEGKVQSPATASTKTGLAVVTPNAEAAKGANQPMPTSADAVAHELDTKADELEAELFNNNMDKANLSAELELLQLQKARFQRDLEAVNDTLGPFKPDADSVDEATRKNVVALEKQSDALQNEFKNAVRQIAEKTAAADKRQRKVKRAQDLLDNIDRLRSQLDMQRILDSAKPSSAPSEPKLEFEERQKPSKDEGDSGRVVRPGDEIVVYRTSKLGERTATRVEVDRNGAINLPAIKVGGMTEHQAKEALQKAVRLNNSNDDVQVEVNAPPQ